MSGAVLLLPLLTLAGPVEDTEEAKALAAKVTDLTTRDPKIQTLRVRGHLQLPKSRLEFRLLYVKPDLFSLEVRDPSDGTPLFMASHHRLLIHEPKESRVIYGEAASVRFVVQMEDGEFKFGFSWGKADASRVDRGWEIRFGLREFLDRGKHRIEARPLPDGKGHEFVGFTESGGRVRAELRRARKPLCTRLRMYQSGVQRPFLDLREIRVNDPVAEREVVKFDRRLLAAAEIPITDWKPLDKDKPAEMQAQFKRLFVALYWREAMRNQSLRSTVEEMLGKKIDWDAVANRNRLLDGKLRKFFPPPEKAEPAK